MEQSKKTSKFTDDYCCNNHNAMRRSITWLDLINLRTIPIGIMCLTNIRTIFGSHFVQPSNRLDPLLGHNGSTFSPGIGYFCYEITRGANQFSKSRT